MKKPVVVAVLFLIFFHPAPVYTAPEVKRPPLPVESLAIPENLGKIDSRFDSGNGRWIIHIQDVHAHRLAQENIAAVIDHLSEVYDVRTVALEGGWSETSFAQSWGLPSSREKHMLGTGLLEEDILTGPAFSALFSNMPVRLVGIEDPALYEKNRQIYLEHLSGKKNLTEKLSALESALEKEKTETFSPDLLAFDKSLTAFLQPSEETSKQAEKFLPLLLQKTAALQIDLAGLDQILLFQKIAAAEKSLDKTKLQAEAARLLKTFKHENLHFEELLRSGKVPEEKISHYPETKSYLEIMRLQDQIEHHAFFEQVYRAIHLVKNKLITSEAEKTLDGKSGRFMVMKKLLLLAATPSDLAAFHTNETVIAGEAEENGLQTSLGLALRFYDAAQERDKVFFKNILSNPHLEGNIAVVTGGFHKAGLTELFLENNISHIVITPNLGGESANENLYEKRIQETVANQTLSDMQNRFLTQGFDSAFVEGVKALKQVADIGKAVAVVAKFIEEGNAPKAPAVRAPADISQGTVSAEAFLKYPKEKQLSLVRSWLKKAKGGTLPVVIAARTSTFQKLLKDPLGEMIWQKVIATENANTIGDIQDNDAYMNEMIGVKAKIVRVKLQGNDIAGAIESRFSGALAEKNLAVIDADYANKQALLLPENPVSLLLARLILEHHVIDVPSAEFVPVFQELVQEILFANKSIKTSA